MNQKTNSDARLELKSNRKTYSQHIECMMWDWAKEIDSMPFLLHHPSSISKCRRTFVFIVYAHRFISLIRYMRLNRLRLHLLILYYYNPTIRTYDFIIYQMDAKERNATLKYINISWFNQFLPHIKSNKQYAKDENIFRTYSTSIENVF